MEKVYIVKTSYDTYKGMGTDIEGVFAKKEDAIKLAREIFESIKPDYLDDPMGKVEVYEDEDGEYFSVHDNDCSHKIGVSWYEVQ